jgi:molecular chaperone DnaJ
LCRVVVETPVKLTREQRELVERLDASLHAGGRRHSPREESWFEGVKEFFSRIRG